MSNKRRVIIILFVTSIVVYGLQMLIFKDPKTTGFYFLQDVAFMPLTIVIATVMIGAIFEEHDKKERIERTKMLTSAFFTEVGEELLQLLVEASDSYKQMTDLFDDVPDEAELKMHIKDMKLHVKLTSERAIELRNTLDVHYMFITINASNPALLEHEKYTDMLWSIYHLRDELKMRDLDRMTKEERKHLEIDATRVLNNLLINWVSHVRYVQKEYPYFYASKYKHIDFYQFFDKI